jgi:hypothetical protein
VQFILSQPRVQASSILEEQSGCDASFGKQYFWQVQVK